MHKVTGKAYDRKAHATVVRDKKLALMRRAYWERGGRQTWLARYMKNRQAPKLKQLTLGETLVAAKASAPETRGNS